jgi:hypothetical protein
MLVDADFSKITVAQKEAILSLSGKRYQHTWQLSEALSDFSPEWKQRPNITLNKTYNKRLRGELAYLIRILQSK